MTLEEQLAIVERDYPDALEYLHDIAGVQLPTYDDNDDVVSWGTAPDIKEGKHHA